MLCRLAFSWLITVLAMLILNFCSPMIFSSSVPRVISLYTFTTRFCKRQMERTKCFHANLISTASLCITSFRQQQPLDTIQGWSNVKLKESQFFMRDLIVQFQCQRKVKSHQNNLDCLNLSTHWYSAEQVCSTTVPVLSYGHGPWPAGPSLGSSHAPQTPRYLHQSGSNPDHQHGWSATAHLLMGHC